MKWEFLSEGRTWARDEVVPKWQLVPKIEIHYGRLFDDESDRLAVFALLLENIGIDKAVLFGDPAMWQEALAKRVNR